MIIRKKFRPVLAAAALIVPQFLVMAAEEQAEILFQENFANTDSVKKWTSCPGMKYIHDGGPNGSGCVKFSYNTLQNSLSSIQLDLKKARCRGLILEAMMKSDNLSKPKFDYLGPKLMIHLKSPYSEVWQDQSKRYGTYDWQKFTTFIRVPANAEKLDLVLGLQGCTGSVSVAAIKITMIPETENYSVPAAESAPLRKTTKYRGVMSGAALGDADIMELGQVWHANLMRFQLSNPQRRNLTTPELLNAWLDEELARLDKVLPLCRKYGVRILIDLHSGPGMSQDELLHNELSWTIASQNMLVAAWEKMAARYKDNPDIWGYDILNEPRENNYIYQPGGALDWNRLAERVAKAIRAVDPVKPVIIEPAMWGSPAGLEAFKPVNVSNVIYSIHFYGPGEFTHQGVHGRPAGINYPGMIGGKKWDKEELRKALAPVREFQQKYQVPVYIGEFSVARWAPGGELWLKDVIDIFEEYGWDWTYHAFREYHGWSVEHGESQSDNSLKKTTPRKEVLLNYFSRNIPVTQKTGTDPLSDISR